MTSSAGATGRSGEDTEFALSMIAKQAATGTAITPSPEGWVSALPKLEDVACEWSFEDTLTRCYLWAEDGDYYAADLPPGLEDREGRPLNRIEALSLLQSGVMHKPVDLSEVADGE